MIAPSKKYANPPIVEAMVEVRFASQKEWTDETLARVTQVVQKRYPGKPRRQTRFDIQAKVNGDDLSTESAVTFHQALFPSEDGLSIVGVGAGQISVHVLAPYLGWEKFLPLVKEAVEMYASEARPDGVSLVGVRYIDQISLPVTAEKPVESFFTCFPKSPSAMPSALDAFHFVTQSRDVERDFSAVLTLASVPTTMPSPRQVVLFDLNLVRIFAGLPANIGDVERHAEFLHAQQKTIFEACITEKTRELFG